MKYSNVFSVRRHRDKHRKRKNIKTTSDKIYVSSFYPLIKHLFVIAQLNKYLFHLQFYTLFILRNYIANLVMSTISSWRIWSFACLVHSKFVVLVNISLGWKRIIVWIVHRMDHCVHGDNGMANSSIAFRLRSFVCREFYVFRTCSERSLSSFDFLGLTFHQQFKCDSIVTYVK